MGDPALFSALFSALQTAMSDLLKTKTRLRSIYYENKVVTVEKRGKVNFMAIGDEPDTAIEAALRKFADLLMAEYPGMQTVDGALTPRSLDEGRVMTMIGESFGRVMF